MSHHFQTDELRVLFYLGENEGWMKTLSSQEDEIPKLEKLLSENSTDPDNKKVFNHFKFALHNQQEMMQELNTALTVQQKRLELDAVEKKLYDVNVICSQDILRDQIKTIEKKYIELKCNFMQFMSGVI